MEQCYIEINHRFMAKSSFISPGNYKITVKKIENTKDFDLQFQSTDYRMKSHFLRVFVTEKNKRNIIQSKGNKNKYPMDEFEKSYYIRAAVEWNIHFSSRQENNKLLKITQFIDTKSEEGLRFKND